MLADDGLRILRLVRFAAELQFKIDPATFACASRLCGNLRDISAEFEAGKAYAIVGGSGSGKSTLPPNAFAMN